ncbi:hypothetical protein [Sorangium sp. So ce388]|uniref:hypothetical protein n=1 Tax=Sorangium sp. So ce388 TaxID=3133309 RepID=UPI003F5BED9D
MELTRDILRVVPYLDIDTIGARRVKLMPMWDGSRWHLWLPGPNGLTLMHPPEAFETDYVARQAARGTDLVIPFVDLMWQRASWAEVCPQISSISADFHNLGTSVAKIDHFFATRKDLGLAATTFVKTELEYIFMLSRSVFDLLQEVVATIWNTYVQLTDEASEARRRSRKLPKTFSKTVLIEKKGAKSPDELVREYVLPPGVADAYSAAAPFFIAVRRFRDAVVHGGKDVRLLYSTEKGFCIQKHMREFADLPIWREEHAFNENIVSLLPLIAYVVLGTIEACNNVMLAFAREIVLPPEIAPGYRVFIRGPHNDALIWMQEVANGASPWWSDRHSGAGVTQGNRPVE